MKQWLRRRIAGLLRAEIANQTSHLQQDIQGLKSAVSPEWVNHMNLMTTDISRHLNAIDQLAQKVDRTQNDIISRVWGLDEATSKTTNDLRILESRVRANPFKIRSLEIASSRDGRNTFGFDSNRTGTYAEFIDMFRPEFDELARQLRYVTTWLPSEGKAVDLGAGRGEMVTVLNSSGLDAFGIDSDQSVVDEAQARGIDIRRQGISEFLKIENAQTYSVVTAIHVVEHVSFEVLTDWLREIKRILKPGGVFILETPNPHAIDAFKAFWVDVTHVRPYYPESLLHMMLSAGFSKAEIWVEGEQQLVSDRLGYAGAYSLIATV